ncbi:MAG: hypothetical protein RBT37_00835 [Dissulfurispiraceae bacterium]|jgi:quinol-cytochrome oxidoreductase complex cytochrome b subunit|nr:hypothetical protein [Dissulfurispiraceae bacterium]
MPDRQTEQKKTFYPHFVAEIAAVIVLCLELLVVMAMLFAPEVGRPIDLSRQYQPRPEWYFLWLFELVRYFPGKSIVIGTVVLPLVSVLLLMFLPFIDRVGRGRNRASIVFCMLVIMPVLLTAIYLFRR